MTSDLLDDAIARVLALDDAALPEIVAILRLLQAARAHAAAEARVLRKGVIEGLRAAIDAHGPITRTGIGSATKRIVGHVQAVKKSHGGGKVPD